MLPSDLVIAINNSRRNTCCIACPRSALPTRRRESFSFYPPYSPYSTSSAQMASRCAPVGSIQKLGREDWRADERSLYAAIAEESAQDSQCLISLSIY